MTDVYKLHTKVPFHFSNINADCRCFTLAPTSSFSENLKFVVKKEIYFLETNLLRVRRNMKLARAT